MRNLIFVLTFLAFAFPALAHNHVPVTFAKATCTLDLDQAPLGPFSCPGLSGVIDVVFEQRWRPDDMNSPSTCQDLGSLKLCQINVDPNLVTSVTIEGQAATLDTSSMFQNYFGGKSGYTDLHGITMGFSVSPAQCPNYDFRLVPQCSQSGTTHNPHAIEWFEDPNFLPPWEWPLGQCYCPTCQESDGGDPNHNPMINFQIKDPNNNSVWWNSPVQCPVYWDCHHTGWDCTWEITTTDSDSDGIVDSHDNCVNTYNPPSARASWQTVTGRPVNPTGSDDLSDPNTLLQLDDDGDGYGNHCDADFNNTHDIINSLDAGLFKGAYFQPVSSSTACNGGPCDQYDLNGSGGLINSLDAGRFSALFGTAKQQGEWVKCDQSLMCDPLHPDFPCVGDACP